MLKTIKLFNIKIALFITLCCGVQSTYAKNINIDSLLLVSENPSNPDTNRLTALFEVAWYGFIYSNPDSAFYFAQKHLRLAKELKNKKHIAQAINVMGAAHYVQGNNKEALHYYLKSYNLILELGDDKNAARVLNNIGVIYHSEGDIKNALKYYDESLVTKEKIDDKKGVAAILKNLGIIYTDIEDFTMASQKFNECLEINTQINNKKGVASALIALGSLYEKFDKLDSAFYFTKRALKLYKEQEDYNGVATSLLNIGAIFFDKNNLDSSLIAYSKCLKIRNEINDKQGVANAKVGLANVYYKLENLRKSLSLAEESYELAMELDILEVKKNASELLYVLYKKLERPDEALEMFELFTVLKDSLSSDVVKHRVLKQEFQHDFEKQKAIDDAKHDKLLAIEYKEKEKQKILTIAIGVGLFLVVIFLVFVFNRLRLTRKQKHVIEVQRDDILASINYAKRIQNAILPPKSEIKKYLVNSFVLYKPKDAVAGDFYWLEQVANTTLFAAADCTGHGVPGAMVSVVCHNAMNRAVREFGLIDPGLILDKTREIVIAEFEKSEDDVKDGMDIALCSLSGTTLKYAGAHNPLWIVRNNELLETKADKQPIGKFDNPTPYVTHTIELQKGDSIYIFSDGYVDQFGGEKDKKFGSKRFKELLISVQDKSMEEQKAILETALKNWMNTSNSEQIDDVCVMGIRV